jgi:hypothetical protein
VWSIICAYGIATHPQHSQRCSSEPRARIRRRYCGARISSIVHELFGGELVSTSIDGHSHWLNRLTADGRTIDADLTGDQFGLPKFQFDEPGRLYRGLRVRPESDLSLETLSRAALLAQKAGLSAVSAALGRRLQDRARQLAANSH